LCAAVAPLLRMRCVCGVRAGSGFGLRLAVRHVRAWWLVCSGRKPDRTASADVAVVLGAVVELYDLRCPGFTSSGESLDPA
jgi:hypothetical protein